MPDVHYKPNHNGSTPGDRIANRLKNSGGGSGADTTLQHGTGPTRAITNLHHSGSQGGLNRGEHDEG
jgi:hypothetical protein